MTVVERTEGAGGPPATQGPEVGMPADATEEERAAARKQAKRRTLSRNWSLFLLFAGPNILLILAFPIITVALTFLQLDRFFGTNFYTTAAGGDPMIWQHLFWLFGHPEVYIIFLPAAGMVPMIIATVGPSWGGRSRA